jgi:hypothetical protein
VIDLGHIQKRLNEDEGFRQQFLTDPVAAVEGEGLKLSDDMKNSLRAFADRAKETHEPARETPEGGGISISISF